MPRLPYTVLGLGTRAAGDLKLANLLHARISTVLSKACMEAPLEQKVDVEQLVNEGGLGSVSSELIAVTARIRAMMARNISVYSIHYNRIIKQCLE